MLGTLAQVNMSSMEDDKEQIRVIFNCPERVRRAIKFREARDGLSGISQVIVAALEQYLPRELAEADEAIAAGEKMPKTKPGRKPKGE